MAAIALLHLLNNVLDRQLSGHLSGLVPADPVGNDNEQDRLSRGSLEGRDRKAVLIDLAGQTGVSLRRHG